MNVATPSVRALLRGAPARGPVVIAPSLVDLHPHGPHEEPAHAIAQALRSNAASILELGRTLVEAGAELLVAPTSCTTANALHATGQAYRAAALTAAAIDLARDAAIAAGGGAAILGEVPAAKAGRARVETTTHVERLVTSAIDGVLVLAEDPDLSREVARAAAAHRLPTIVELESAQVDAILPALEGAAPDAILVRVGSAHDAAAVVARARALLPTIAIGVRLAVRPPRMATDARSVVLDAWPALAGLDLALVGLAGPASGSAVATLVDLARSTR